MGLNPKAPAWTPGPSSSGDRRGDSLGRIRRVVHGVGTHKSVDGAETMGVGGLNLPKKKDKHRANLHIQRVQQAIQGFVGGGDSFLSIYFIFFTCIGIPIYVGYFVCDSASEFGAMGSTSFFGVFLP